MDKIFEKLVLYYGSISSWLEKPNDFSKEEQKRFKWIFWGSIGILYIILTILFGAINFWGSLLLGSICEYILWNTKWKLWKRVLVSCFVYITLVSILPYNDDSFTGDPKKDAEIALERVMENPNNYHEIMDEYGVFAVKNKLGGRTVHEMMDWFGVLMDEKMEEERSN